MDIKSFLNTLLRYKWLLIITPIVVVSITYFLVQNLPKEYASDVQISTGLLDPSKKVISEQNVDFFSISQQFNGIMEKIKMKKVINLLSYNLILHDLENPNKSFRKYSEKIDSLSKEDKAEVINSFKQKLANKSILALSDNKGKYKLYDIVGSMGYDEEGLREKLDITHQDNSDFINIEFVSEDPDLSAFIVNTLATEFINIYSYDVNINQNNNIVLLDSLLKNKEALMNDKNSALSSFKRNKGVLNLNEQSATVYAQITQYEAQRADALKTIQSNIAAISAIESKLGGSDAYISGSSRSDNLEIVSLKRKLEAANAAWIDGGFKASDQKKIDSLSQIIQARSTKNADENVMDPRASKQGLVQQKINLEVGVQQAKSVVRSMDGELKSLRGKYASMVPYDADIHNYERDADLATKDYMAALDRYNQTRTEKNMGLRLNIEQIGLPGNPEPSKKIIYLAGSGFGSLFLCLGYIFVVFILDRTIRTTSQLALATNANTIGVLNRIVSNERSVREIWNDKSGNPNYEMYREMLRAIRFEISSKMDADNSKILGITSLNANEGKTFVAHSLAYAFAMTGKKILLIADEAPYVKTDSEKALTTKQNFQTFLIKKEFHTEDLITIMNKNTARTSLLEIQSVKSLKAGFEMLREEFDLIIVDVNSLHDINLAKEWLLFTEKNIAIFEYGTTVNEGDKELTDYIKNLPGFLGWVLNKMQIKQTGFSTLDKGLS
ncbi:lipopolysaccharide biosynthesis protein [Pedobacter sp. ASV1-7]|uniref:exopolysaccharide transport family protein n=1 Tax=Pedobacter sp. ASV1-7 TaxID=3145237 RepID=UPI0032E87E1E